MPSGLLSNLNVAFSFGFPRAVRVKQIQPLNFIEALSSHNNSSGGLRHSVARSNRQIMAASGSIVSSTDLVVDSLVSNCGSASGFSNPAGVFFSDRSYKICRRARMSMRSESHHGVQGCFVFDIDRSSKGLSNGRTFSSSCYSDGIVPQVSADGSLSAAEQLSSLAISDEQRSPRGSILKLISGACYMPHPAKEQTGGEDAHFICAEEQVVGVADGVGGWADVGVNAGDYARELMSHSVKAIREVTNGDVDPLRVLEKAHAETKAMGSSTACIIALKNQNLHAINLGDSGFIIVRDGQTIFEAPVQLHGFNFPYQLGRDNNGDPPSSGQVVKISVSPGDVVVAGSDGLFDNLFNNEIATIVDDSVKEGLNPDATAQKIAAFARERALDRKHQTPFSTAAQQAGFHYYGGKLDDLTVVVSYVST